MPCAERPARQKSRTIHRLSVWIARDGPLDSAGHPHYLGAGRNARIALTDIHVVRDSVNQATIPKNILHRYGT